MSSDPFDPENGGGRDMIERRLRAEQDRLQTQLAGLERTFDELVAAADVEPADDEHDPSGTTAYERAQVASLAAIVRARLVELGRALDGVGDEDFGVCTSCGQPIGAERLDALPATTTCVACAAAGRSPRPADRRG